MPKKVMGFGVVGTWRTTGSKLGGTMPQWLSEKMSSALYEVDGNMRMEAFLEETEQYMCKITVEPIARMKKVKVLKIQ